MSQASFALQGQSGPLILIGWTEGGGPAGPAEDREARAGAWRAAQAGKKRPWCGTVKVTGGREALALSVLFRRLRGKGEPFGGPNRVDTMRSATLGVVVLLRDGRDGEWLLINR